MYIEVTIPYMIKTFDQAEKIINIVNKFCHVLEDCNRQVELNNFPQIILNSFLQLRFNSLLN
jgi:hypothetical protein